MAEYVEKYRNSYELLDPQVASKTSLSVIGAGAIGSFFVMTAAKMGFSDITVFDHDKIELHNFANQMYPEGTIGKFKVDALAEVVKQYTGVSIFTRNFKWSPRTHKRTSIQVVCVDNMSTRAELFSTIRGASQILVDGRMGAQVYRTFAIDLSNNEHLDYYEKTLHTDEQGVQERCGQKSIIYNVLGVASDMLNATRRLSMGLETAVETVRDYDGNILVPTWKNVRPVEVL